MAFRGRGRGGAAGGRGGYGGFGGRGHGTPAPVVLFPDVTLPDKTPLSAEDTTLVQSKIKLQSFWRSSPYYIEVATEKSQSVDIERFAEKGKPRRSRKRENLNALLKCSSFPIELHDVLLGKRGPKQGARKKARSDNVKDVESMDRLLKLECEGQVDKFTPKKVEDEEDDAEDDEEEDSEYSDEGDYNQNECFDDDDDDFNDDAAGGSDNDEGIL